MEQTPTEWLVKEINKLNVSTEARLFIEKLGKQAKLMEKERLESLKDFDTWKEWKHDNQVLVDMIKEYCNKI